MVRRTLRTFVYTRSPCTCSRLQVTWQHFIWAVWLSCCSRWRCRWRATGLIFFCEPQWGTWSNPDAPCFTAVGEGLVYVSRGRAAPPPPPTPPTTKTKLSIVYVCKRSPLFSLCTELNACGLFSTGDVQIYFWRAVVSSAVFLLTPVTLLTLFLTADPWTELAQKF